jgi:hypothetical protein
MPIYWNGYLPLRMFISSVCEGSIWNFLEININFKMRKRNSLGSSKFDSWRSVQIQYSITGIIKAEKL